MGPVADFIVSVSTDGVAQSRGHDLLGTLTSEPTLKEEFVHDEEALVKDALTIDPLPVDGKGKGKERNGKLIVAEEIQVGSISWKPVKFLFTALGGDRIGLFFVLWISGSIFEYFMHSFMLWYLGYLSSQYEEHPIEDIPVLK